jgi:hypothetical protein
VTRCRRLVRDSEKRIGVSDAMILAAMGGVLLRRTAGIPFRGAAIGSLDAG